MAGDEARCVRVMTAARARLRARRTDLGRGTLTAGRGWRGANDQLCERCALRLASTYNAKSLVTMLGAGKEIRTPDLLITSNLGLNGVLTATIAGGTLIALERKPPSYQLSWHAARVDVVHSHQLTSRGCHQQALEPPYREVSVRSVPGSVVAQQHAGAIAKPRHPRVLKSMRSP
jgi:hypothetical protein